MRTARNASSHATGEAAELLERLHGADGLFLRRTRQGPHLGQTGDDARRLLDRAEGGRVGAGHHHRRDDRGAAELRPEELARSSGA